MAKMQSKSRSYFVVHFITLFLFSNNLFAQVMKGEMPYKDKMINEEWIIDKELCIKNGITNFNDLRTCVIGKGWKFISRENFDTDKNFCTNQAKINEKVNFRNYYACMLAKNYDIQTNFNKEMEVFTDQFQKECENPRYRQIFLNSPCKLSDISIEHLALESRITSEQKKVYIEHLKNLEEYEKRSAAIRDTSKSSANKLKTKYQINNYSPALTNAKLDLLSGKITWGEFNKIRKELFSVRTAEFNKIDVSYQVDLKDREALIQKKIRDTASANSFSSQVQTQTYQPPPVVNKVIGSVFDREANANIYLFDGVCQINNFSNSYPLRWEAKAVSNNNVIAEGCYSVNQQSNQVAMIVATGKTVTVPLSSFQGGAAGNSSDNGVFGQVGGFIQRWAAAVQDAQKAIPPPVNLTPGMTGTNNGMNCTPDGRGGFNCR